MTWKWPDQTNNAAGLFTYVINFYNGTGYDKLPQTITSTAALTGTVTVNLETLKTAVGSTVGAAGQFVKAKITANNGYGDVTSDENVDSAVYQSVPAIYAGTYTESNVQDTQITISWTNYYTTAALRGYAPITEYFYGYWVGTTGAFTNSTSTSTSVTISGLAENTEYQFFVQGLNVYSTATTFST